METPFLTLLLSDGAYRLFYDKAGTRSLFLWSERSLSGQYSDLFVPDLLNKLIPMSEGKNPELSIAKYAARISLFDSQTIPVRIPDFIAWGKIVAHRVWFVF